MPNADTSQPKPYARSVHHNIVFSISLPTISVQAPTSNNEHTNHPSPFPSQEIRLHHSLGCDQRYPTSCSEILLTVKTSPVCLHLAFTILPVASTRRITCFEVAHPLQQTTLALAFSRPRTIALFDRNYPTNPSLQNSPSMSL